jgi:hypothetical protein
MPRIRLAGDSKRPLSALTLGDLIAAAYDALGETKGVAKVLGSNALAARIGRQIVVD